MQSDRESFRGDFVLGSFNMANRDDGSILDQKYEKQIFLNPYIEDIEENAYLKKYST